MNIFLKIIKYDAGLMDRHEELVFFQHLLDIGLLPYMSAHYQQTAQWLLAAGEINAERVRTV